MYVCLRGASTSLYVNAVSSSEAASLHGQKAKTPIIAGSICGGVMGLAWIIGFAIYFRKRYKRKRHNKAALAAGQNLEEEHNSEEERQPVEKIVIPPDPAILMGYHRSGAPSMSTKGKNLSASQADVVSIPPDPNISRTGDFDTRSN